MDARKSPGARVPVSIGCGAGGIAAKEESGDDDDAAGGESGRSSAMVDGDACTHPVGPCSSDSAGAQLGSLNVAAAAATATATSPYTTLHPMMVRRAQKAAAKAADTDDAGGSKEESSSAMDDGGASIWNPPTSKGENGVVVHHDKAARCVSFSAANLMHAAGDIAGAAAIAHGAPKGLLLKQLAARINDTTTGQMCKI